MRHARRILAWTVAGLCGLALLAAAGGLWFLNMAGETTWTTVLRLALDAASTPGETVLRAERFRRDADGTIRLGHFAIADADGTWLTIDDLALDLDLVDLAGGALTVERLSVARIEVARAPVADVGPEPEAEAPSGPWMESFAWPRAPVPVHLGQLRIDAVALGPGLLPEPLTLAVDGAFSDRGTAQSLVLALRPVVEGRGGTVDADIAIDFASRTSRIALSGDLPAITPLAEALDIAAGNRIHLSMHGGGPFGGARVQLDASVQSVADMAATLALAADPATGWRVSLDALVNAVPGGPVPVDLTGAVIALHLAASGPDGTRARLDALTLDLDGVSVQASGHYDAAGDDLALDIAGHVQPTAAALSLLDGVGFADANLTARLRGSPANLDVRLDSRIDGLDAGGPGADRLDLSATAKVAGSVVEGRFGLTLDRPTPGLPAAEAMLGARPQLQARFTVRADRATLDAIRLDAAAFTLSGNLATALPDPRLDGTLRLVVPDLARVPDVQPLIRGGAGTLELTATDLSPDGGGRLLLGGGFDGLAFVEPLLRDLVGPSVTLDAELAPTADGGAMVARVTTAAGAGLSVDVTMNAAGGAGGSYALSVPKLPADLLPAGVVAAGPLKLSGTVSGSADRPATRGRLTLPAITRGDLRLGSAVLEFAASDLSVAPQGTLDLKAALNGAALTLGSRFSLAEDFDHLAVRDARLVLAGASLAARADAALSAARYSAHADLDIPDAAGLASLFGIQATGRIGAVADLRPAGGDHAVSIRLTGDTLSVPGAADLDSVRLDMSLADVIAGEPALAGTLQIGGIAASGAVIDSVSARLGGSALAPTLEMEVVSSLPVAARVTLAANAGLDDPAGPAITVSRVDFEGLGQTAATTGPFRLVAGDAIRLEGLRITSSLQATLAADAMYGPDAIRADLVIAGVHLDRVGQLAGITGLGGNVDAIVRVDTDAAEKARIEVRAAGVTLPDVPRDKPFDLGANTSWDGDTASGRLVLTGPFGRALEASLTAGMPTGPDGLLPAPDMDAALGASLDWAGELGELMDLLPEGDHLLSGAARIAVTASGTLGAPVIRGEVAIDNGRYENLLTGTILQSIALKAGFDQDGSGTLALDARDQAGGTLTGSGAIRTGGAARGGRVQLEMRTLQAVLRDEARVVLSGTTTLDWDGRTVAVVNRTTVNDAEIRLIDNALPPDVVAIELSGDTADTRSRAEAAPADDLPVSLDVLVDIPGRFFVRGRGLESEWGGQVAVRGTLPSPTIEADLKVLRGQLSLLGKDFAVASGTIALAGGRPLFDIRLERQTADLTGVISITGTPATPKLEFSSVPELPSDEVLPRIFFDKSAQSLSAVEAVQLAQGLRTLSSGDRGITDRIRDTVGLDVLRVEEGATPDSTGAVSVGRYVREGVYVGAKQSLDSGEGGVVVEIDLLPNLKVDAEVGRTGQGSTGITWERKY